MWIWINLDKPYTIVKGSQLEMHLQVVKGTVKIVQMSRFSWRGQNLCRLSLELIIQLRVVLSVLAWFQDTIRSQKVSRTKME